MRTRLLFAIVFVVWTILIGFTLAYSVTRFVSDLTGDDTFTCTLIQDDSFPAKTIQRCIDCSAGAGDICEVLAGTYSETPDLNKSGTTGNPFILRNRSAEVVTIDATGINPGSPTAAILTFTTSVSFVHIQGIRIINAQSTLQPSTVGIAFQNGANHILVDGILIDGTGGSGIELIAGGNSFITIRNSTIQNFEGNAGLHVDDGAQIAFKNNVVQNSVGVIAGSANILMTHTEQAVIINNIVSNGCDMIRISGDDGPAARTGDRLVVRGNTLTNIGTPVQCLANGNRGIHLRGGAGLGFGHGFMGIAQNTIIGDTNTDAGIELVQAIHDIFIWNNSIVGTNRGLWDLSGCFGSNGLLTKVVNIQNNIFGDTRTGPTIEQWNKSIITDFTASHNLLFNPGKDLYLWDDDGDDNGEICPDSLTAYDISGFTTQTGEGTLSTNNDPLFVDESLNDLNLMATSQAIDMGDHIFHTRASGAATTVIPVDTDARLFFANPPDLYEVAQDTIQIGTTVVKVVSVAFVGPALETDITVDAPVTFGSGDGVHYVWTGSSPDMGAHEFVMAGTSTRRKVRPRVFR